MRDALPLGRSKIDVPERYPGTYGFGRRFRWGIRCAQHWSDDTQHYQRGFECLVPEPGAILLFDVHITSPST